MSTERSWRVQLFGAVRVTTPSGDTISLNGRKAGELLACVALRPDQGRTRTELVHLLWADTDVTSVRTRLRQEIAALRAQFRSDGGLDPLLVITQDDMRLGPQSETDAERFVTCCTTAAQQSDLQSKIGLLREACSLYHAPLLSEFSASWIIPERLRFERLFEQASIGLAEALLQNHEAAEADATLRRLLANNPICEEAHIALMRVYAWQAQPDRVRQQYQELENALVSAGDLRPTDGTQKLAVSLREEAGWRAAQSRARATPDQHDASAVSESGPLPQAPQLPGPLTASDSRPSIPAAGRPVRAPARSSRLRLRFLSLILIICSAGLWSWKNSHPDHLPSPSGSSLANTLPRWVFLYRPQPGEKPDAEATSAIATEKSIYATGFINTQKEDVDILTVKLSPAGTLLWSRRYSSPEHDCDRAFSVWLEGRDSVYVGGETYVPAGHGVPEGWRLTLLRYDREGRRLWARRSPTIVQNEGHNIQVVGDRHGGCYLAGTALTGDKHAILVLRYDRSGHLIWQKTVREGSSSWFSQFACNQEGMLTLCGTARRDEGAGSVNDDWLVVRLDDRGNVVWQRSLDGPTHGSDSARRILLDSSDNAFVAGVFDTGDPAHGGKGMNLAIAKFGQDGTRLWQRIADDSGPNVALDGLSLNHLGDVAIGGTRRYADDTTGIVAFRYDSLGFLTQTLHYSPPPGYKSVMLKAASVDNNDNLQCMGRIGEGSASGMNFVSSLLCTAIDPTGRPVVRSVFSPVANQPNRENGCIPALDSRLTCFGQAGQEKGERAFLVFLY